MKISIKLSVVAEFRHAAIAVVEQSSAVLIIALAICSFRAATEAQAIPQPPPLPIAYYAVAPFDTGGSIEYDYDHGKFAIRRPGALRLYDGSSPPIRWSVDLRTRIAHVDRDVAYRYLFMAIKARGVQSVARSTGLAQDRLLRFRSDFPEFSDQDLDHLLYRPTSAEIAGYVARGTGDVCGYRCTVYESKQKPGNKMWVERSTGFVFRRHYLEVPGNPRIEPQLRDWQLTSFKKATSLDAARSRLPPGTTAELPRILADMPLPPGVRRKIMTGKDAELGTAVIP